VEVGRGRTEISLLAFTMCGTPEFMAPEFCMSVGYDQGADWWAFGCVLFEMYMGRNPFDTGGDLKRTFKEICMIGMGKAKLQLHPKFKTTFPDAANILENLLTHAAGRLGKMPNDAQAAPYFKNIDFDDLRALKAEAPYVPSVRSETDLFYFEKGLEDIKEEKTVPYTGDNEWCRDF
jgi:serine/threonine protein kinase